MNLDLAKEAFSFRGSWLAFGMGSSESGDGDVVYLRSATGEAAGNREIFRLELISGGHSVPYFASATEAVLTLASAEGTVEMVFESPYTVRARGCGVGLRFSRPMVHVVPGPGAHIRVRTVDNLKFMFNVLEGRLRTEPARGATHLRTGSGGPLFVADVTPQDYADTFEMALESYVGEHAPQQHRRSFETCSDLSSRSFVSFLTRTPEGVAEYSAARERAAYVNWSSMVNPLGIIDRETMLMSKNRVTSVWSWDSSFNAMALALGQPALAWSHFRMFFDWADEAGGLPEAATNIHKSYTFSRPPVQGWVLRWLLEHTDWLTLTNLADIYRPLSRWTEWWFNFRDEEGDLVCQYHHGNDSGWENASLFDGGFPVKTPDLSAFLVVQLEVLAEIAHRIGREQEAQDWALKADQTRSAMLTQLWDGKRFIARHLARGEVVETGGFCGLSNVPIILGDSLPVDVRSTLVECLRPDGPFATAHGPATESPRSPHYRADGFWRGSVWAPYTLLLVDGLARCGYREYARELAVRFCNTCVFSGFAQAFNAANGKGQNDPAYTWTSSIFLILSHCYINNPPGSHRGGNNDGRIFRAA